jgi:uncharacterized OB-fold protein
MAEMETNKPAPRMLSLLPPVGNGFWTSGKSGALILQRNRVTGQWLHPFWRVADDDPDVVLEPVSGKATVFTFTINLHTYNPQVSPPYVIAIVQLPEQEDLRLVTNIVNCRPEDVEIGMQLRVAFEPHGENFVPVFEPDL